MGIVNSLLVEISTRVGESSSIFYYAYPLTVPIELVFLMELVNIHRGLAATKLATRPLSTLTEHP